MDDKIIWDWETDGLERYVEIDDSAQIIDIDLYSTNYEQVSLNSLYLFMEKYCSTNEVQSAMTPINGGNIYHFIHGWTLTERAAKTVTGGIFKRIYFDSRKIT